MIFYIVYIDEVVKSGCWEWLVVEGVEIEIVLGYGGGVCCVFVDVECYGVVFWVSLSWMCDWFGVFLCLLYYVWVNDCCVFNC